MKAISRIKLNNATISHLPRCIPPTVIFLGLFFLWPFALHAVETIKIASIYSLSGPAAKANSTSVLGVSLAVEEINTTGGILGMPLELLELDNRSTPIGSKVAADQAADQNVTAIIGAAFSSHSLAIAKVAQAHGIPMITNISTNPSVTRIGNFIFRACFDDTLQGKVMGQFAREELKAQNVVAVFNVASDYSLGLTRTFEKSFIEWGGVMQAKIPYKSRQPHFRDIIAQAMALKPDVLFIAGHDESARIVGEAIQMGLNAIPLGGDGWDEKSFFNLGGNKIEKGYYATHWSRASNSTPSRNFVARYGDLEMILAPTALAYDAVMLLKDAIERAGRVQRPAIRDALAQTMGYEGVTGTFSFNHHGDPIKNVVIMKITSGRPVYLKQIVPDNDKK